MKKFGTIIDSTLGGLINTFELRDDRSSLAKVRKNGSNTAVLQQDRKNHIFTIPLYRKYLLIATIASIVQFIVFKLLYPFPDLISDSNSYIATNIYQMDVNLWPVGYSKFLAFIHMISHSATFLVAVQYVLLQASLMYFFYTVTYLYRPGKKATNVLYAFLIFNPIFLYLSNCILSDSIFAALTIVFFAQFLWMYRNPTNVQIILQGVIIGLAFTIRYTAVYYPAVTIFGFAISQVSLSKKIAGSLLGIALMIPFYLYTVQKTKVATGTAEFSVFGGWQIANNALYMYGHIQVDSSKLPKGTIELDRLSRAFFQKVNPSAQELAELPGTYFIKVPYAILKPYMQSRYSYNNPVDQFKTWGQVSPIYNRYGKYLMTHYPVPFFQYYLWLNTKNYFLPHLEKFEIYNYGENYVPALVQDWFDYVTPYVTSVSATVQNKIFYVYPIFFMCLNFYFIGIMIWLAITGRMKRLNKEFRIGLYFLSAFLLLNFAFSVFATPVVLRYQVVPMILLFAFSLFLFELPLSGNKKTLQSIPNA